MSSNLTNPPTSDLRSEAKPYQRDKTHNTKWANGVTTRSGVTCRHLGPFERGCMECPVKPMGFRLQTHGYNKHRKLESKKQNGQASTLARKAFQNEVSDALDRPLARVTDTSSGDEEVQDASAAPHPVEADFMYNYDAPAGPCAGTDVLSFAVTQAVRRFENNETEKLINKEYDVIDENKEGYTADEDDDDYEMIDQSHLN